MAIEFKSYLHDDFIRFLISLFEVDMLLTEEHLYQLLKTLNFPSDQFHSQYEYRLNLLNHIKASSLTLQDLLFLRYKLKRDAERFELYSSWEDAFKTILLDDANLQILCDYYFWIKELCLLPFLAKEQEALSALNSNDNVFPTVSKFQLMRIILLLRKSINEIGVDQNLNNTFKYIDQVSDIDLAFDWDGLFELSPQMSFNQILHISKFAIAIRKFTKRISIVIILFYVRM